MWHRQLGYHLFFWGWVHSLAQLMNAVNVTDPVREPQWQAYSQSLLEQPVGDEQFAPDRQPTQAQYYAMPTQVHPF